jgi:hypothetical protein
MDNTQQYPELIKTLIKIGNYVKNTYQQNLKDYDKIASGKLYNSIDYRLELTENGCRLYFLAEDYYIDIENGRLAGAEMPPVEDIQRWMVFKGIKPIKGYTLSEAAFAISRSIEEKGIKANPFLGEIKKGLGDYMNDIKSALESDLNRNVKLIINKLENVKGNEYIQIKKK